MASFRGHLAFSASLGAAYGGLIAWQLEVNWGTAVLAGGLTAVGGMLPDLDSDSGVPVREMFSLAGIVMPLMFIRRFLTLGLELDQILVALGIVFVVVRYGVSYIFKRFTVHRGMFHSIPAMFIAGFATFLLYPHQLISSRLAVTIGVMIGFFSHLLLDEIYAVDFRGLKPALNQFAGSALKFTSKSKFATAMTYLVMIALGVLVFFDAGKKPDDLPLLANIPHQSAPAVSAPDTSTPASRVEK